MAQYKVHVQSPGAIVKVFAVSSIERAVEATRDQIVYNAAWASGAGKSWKYFVTDGPKLLGKLSYDERRGEWLFDDGHGPPLVWGFTSFDPDTMRKA